MGNRAVIAFGNDNPNTIAIYLHWNGGRASVEGFLQGCKQLPMRLGDDQYTPARVVQAIGNWLGGTLSLGIGTVKTCDCDNGDNGLYIVDDKLNIIERKFTRGGEEIDAEKTATIAAEVVSKSIAFYPKKEAA